MTTAQLKKLQANAKDMNQKWIQHGGVLTAYTCRHCHNSIPTRQPSAKDVGSKGYWDSLTTCAKCGQTNFVTTFPDGSTESEKVDI